MTTVTRQFLDNFEVFAAHRMAAGEFTEEDVADLKKLIRIDLDPGPDQLRQECFFLNAAGVKIPATIDDVSDRYRLWDEFFSAEVEAIELAENDGCRRHENGRA